jgi:ABC-type multidrug transport system fused ATPase/permease subunit
LGEVTDSFYDISNWRWIALQVASSLSIGLSLGFVVYKIVNKTAPVGDLVLVIGYLAQIQESLNIVTNAISQVVQAKISLERLRRAIRIHD